MRSQKLHDEVFEPGEHVWVRQQRWRVARLHRVHGVVRLDLDGRRGPKTLLLPFERPERLAAIDKPRRVRSQHAIARLSAIVGRACHARTLPSLLDARLTILPHQLEPALAAASGVRRLLIADDVGLGKTLQAALIVAETLRRRPLARVLVVTPASIVRQWSEELSSRFDIGSRFADQEGLDAAARSLAIDDNPWRQAGVWITTADFLKQPHVFAALPLEPWDVVILDEAHGVCGDTQRFSFANAITRRARRLVLLTATPHSGEHDRFRRLQDLGELPGGADTLTVFRRSRCSLGIQARRHVRWIGVALRSAETALLDALSGFESVTIRAAGQSRAQAAELLLSVFRKRALSTMAALSVSLARRLAWLDSAGDIELRSPEQARLDFGDDLSAGDHAALSAVTGLDSGKERRWLRRLQSLAVSARREESKLRWLRRALGRTREPVVVFTEFRDSMETVRIGLAQTRTVAAVHGGLTLADRHHELQRFLEGAASVLVATDVAGQGLNLHARARWVVNLELPWNPLRLEQRAGRVDRLGQARAVHVTMLIARHPAESGVLRRLAHRALAARSAVGDDAVAFLPPMVDEPAVGRALFGGAPLAEVTTTPRLNVCRRWRRPAAALSRDLVRRRALAHQWRVPMALEVWTPMRITRGSMTRRQAMPGGALLIFQVPLLDASGELLESPVIVLAASSATTRRLGERELTEVCRRRAQAALVARARRLERWRDRLVRLDVALERRLMAAAGGQPPELQPGLFDRRAVRDVERVAIARARMHDALSARIDDLEVGTRVTIGRASLILFAGERPAAR